MLTQKRRVAAALLRRMGERAASAIAPRDSAPRSDWGILTLLVLKSAQDLRRPITLDEDSYLFIAGPAWSDSRQYVVYTALDEAKKTALYLMRLEELFKGPSVSPRENRISRLMLSHLIEEIRARERRLLELLVTMVLFTSTNEQPYFRHLLLLEELEEKLSANQDNLDFFGARNTNIDDSIASDISDIRHTESRVALGKAWYVQSPKPLAELPQLKPGRLFSSFRTRMKTALPLMTPPEKLLIRLTYGGGYGLASAVSHYRVASSDYLLRSGDEIAAGKSLGILALAILKRCHEILGKPPFPRLEQLDQALRTTAASDALHSLTAGEIEVGDFIIAHGYLCEVKEAATTEFGYRSFRASYVSDRPKPSLQEDWFPAAAVKRFYSPPELRARLYQMVAQGELPSPIADRLDQLSHDDLQPFIRSAMVETWKALNRRAAGSPSFQAQS